MSFRPKKRLGQNFLVDETLRDQVLEAARIAPHDEVLEIGAGPGTLTDRLAEMSKRMVAVELDARLARELRRRYAGRANVEVVEADILELDLATVFPEGGEVVVGNIPYYLTGALLPLLLDRPPRPKRISLVVQREVAERWTAATGASVATLAVQLFTEPRLEFRLPAGAFDPPPKVESALVVMEVRKRPAIELDDPQAFLRFAERLFQFRRKQLGSSLPRVMDRPATEVAPILESASIDATRRAETLTLGEWARLFRTARP
ncbi:MAG TPA: 16S rRNA (adenine(1518)-N(6)/adenine(1519)-N(6))-dimethyltransferase RsmA [Candidatus Dormibacteraeota bacterium]